jgi:hypothetical protein
MCRDLPFVNAGFSRAPHSRPLVIDTTDGAYAAVDFFEPTRFTNTAIWSIHSLIEWNADARSLHAMRKSLPVSPASSGSQH